MTKNHYAISALQSMDTGLLQVWTLEHLCRQSYLTL